jgi:deoxyribodipyrimidine photo-lyase
MAKNNILIYLLRRDTRVSDNPILHHVANSKHEFTHMLPVFVFPAQQMEISGFLKDDAKSPYPAALSPVGGYWRCGPHRAKLIAQSIWDVKTSLDSIGSGLAVRVGMLGDVIDHLLEGFQASGQRVGAVWMIREEGVEEVRDERAVAARCDENKVPLKVWDDEKYFVDE